MTKSSASKETGESRSEEADVPEPTVYTSANEASDQDVEDTRANEDRTSEVRAADDRSEEERLAMSRAVAWDYSTLPAPPDSPANADFAYRYVRVELANVPDPGNFGRALQRGFVPVQPEELPGFHAPTIKNGDFNGMIGIQGLVLCKIPKSFLKVKKDMIAKKNDLLVRAVQDNALSIQDKRMPFVDHKNESSVSRGVALRD